VEELTEVTASCGVEEALRTLYDDEHAHGNAKQTEDVRVTLLVEPAHEQAHSRTARKRTVLVSLPFFTVSTTATSAWVS
jgi:hypothetical protein